MLCAPLLSRALQSPVAARIVEMCTSRGLEQVTLAARPAISLAHHDRSHEAQASDHDGAACDYCLLAVRLLPLLAVVLALLPVARAVAIPAAAGTGPVLQRGWPAHPARGPPQVA